MSGGPRLRRATRNQVELMSSALDDLVAEDHPVRRIWDLVCKLDLSSMLEAIEARGDAPGRAATDPRILLALWVFALSEGVASARQIERLSERDIAYRWICGGVGVNHHSLSDFRSLRGADIDGLLTQTIAILMHAGVVTLRAVAQDGMRVRANAGSSSFRREETLAELLEVARKEVTRLRSEMDTDPSAASRSQTQRQRTAEEHLKGIEAALAEMPKVLEARAAHVKRDKKAGAKRKAPRVSTTDPDARVMKMADGGFRPALNIQFATDVDSTVIVGVGVTNEGTDARQIEPLLADVGQRTDTLPEAYLADGGFATHENIDALAGMGIEPFMPVRASKDANVDRHAPRKDDSAEAAEWRQRMATDEAKQVYRDRAATAELVNAQMRQRHGLMQLPVRGIPKVTSCVLLSALAFNLLRMASLMG